MKQLEGRLSAKGLKVAVVVSRFNSFITKELLNGALDCWRRHEGKDDDFTAVWVPGAFELAPAAKKTAASGRYDAVVCLGAVIRGATSHFDFVAGQAAKGIAQVALDSSVPVIFGVLTTDSIEQAMERAGTKAGNKGWDAMLSAVEMRRVYDQLT